MARTNPSSRSARSTLKSTSGKVLASVALLGVAASVAGLGTYGSFTSTTSASETVTAGTVNVALGAAGSAANRLTVPAAGVVPGDSIQRAATLTNAGNQDFGGVTLSTTTTTPATKLTSDAVNGLQLSVDACSVPWTEAGTAPAYTYTCAGTVTSVLTTRPILGTDVALTNLTSMTSTKADNLRVTATLPVAADNTFQGLTSTVNVAFTATQRAATNR
ncbi:TasA family protein (plasmid) [Arthrobacter agilis]|uniref:TasA family protein n=1 Tax=Arthrobacter agilis TaxID=37921 RepID=UPI0023670B3B|nr:TasA family protein [Arthrobacter agilis]WDF35102.1 TasA family protein [Arthrobacter agilis]